MEYSYLEHHGIKGQKWGVRRKLRSAAQSAKRQVVRMINRNGEIVRATRVERAQASVDRKKAKLIKKQGRQELKAMKKNHSSQSQSEKSADSLRANSKQSIDSVSNEELQAIVRRLTLENSYNDQKAKQLGKSSTQKALDMLDTVTKIGKAVDSAYMTYDKLNQRFGSSKSAKRK